MKPLDEHKQRVGAQIREARERAGLSQEALGHKCGLTATAVRNWEQGHSFPRRMHWPALEQALELPDGWFYMLQRSSGQDSAAIVAVAQTGGVNHGTVAQVVNAAPVVSSPGPGGGEIVSDLCGLIAEHLAGKSTDEKIEFRARVKRMMEGEGGDGPG